MRSDLHDVTDPLFLDSVLSKALPPPGSTSSTGYENEPHDDDYDDAH
ncbi:hypothetical protein BFJ63_vAg14752 [Fusarium oxysporum f. sp. narcissi]|jgi:hypothetical protein|uniref:Uncharacterized protein n=3 Tax=Fusarium oxysporum TaxID=5507 RepID=A0A420N4X4_FUSOX|nr:hypothetical protein FOMA001_g8110 [Fusarium oxysporum f. sp. matthiolae]KAK2681357.1 hypothetical protein RAB80_003150 [Fusarium oxysporum f. sp. vasinfectum]KAK2695360.1 hypothetical protein QWA68_006824 [Fusarium oxysporum]RKK20591.1 hypothetical protein BFJ65_g7290 [Fusarium oxysporum f. sp. cepae]RYC82365.1 hypothetical protein BFJ63_vAg14752 [Fusarium oxysporum f. sp. narcissi]